MTRTNSQSKPYQGVARMLVIAILFGISVLFLLTISGLTWTSRENLGESQSKAEHYRSLDRGSVLLARSLLVAESLQRGYLLTADEGFRESFTEALEQQRGLIADLARESKADPDLRPLFEQLISDIEERNDQLLRVSSLAETEGIEAALAAFETEEANLLSGKIRDTLRKLGEEMEKDLVGADETYRESVQKNARLMNFAAIAALGAGVVGLTFLIGHVRSRGRELALEREKNAAEEADREKSKFLASMNHEMRTPLSAMLGFTELLEPEVKTERGVRYLTAVRKSGESLAALINDVLDLSKIEAGVLELDEEPIRLREFANSIELMFEGEAAARAFELSVSVAADSPSVLVLDNMRLRQVIVNLVGNAIKFTEEGYVAVRFRTESTLEQRGECDLIIEVEDTGRGIDAEQQKEIFRPFQQARLSDEAEGGTGLGLSICRELVEVMDGVIEVESEVGQGSLFRVRLPKRSQGSRVDEKLDKGGDDWDLDDLEASRILVVDDNQYNRDLIEGFFEDTHHTLDFAVNGREALRCLKQSSFDLVLMDIRMPVMDGEEARQHMLEYPAMADVPVIAITASSLLRQERRLRKSFDGYLRKPFTGARLYATIAESIPMREDAMRERASDSSRGEPTRTETGSKSSETTPGREPDEQAPAELLIELEELHRDEWRALSDAMVFSEVREMADRIDELGARHDVSRLRVYATELRGRVDQFDTAGLEKELSRFPELISSLRRRN